MKHVIIESSYTVVRLKHPKCSNQKKLGIFWFQRWALQETAAWPWPQASSARVAWRWTQRRAAATWAPRGTGCGGWSWQPTEVAASGGRRVWSGENRHQNTAISWKKRQNTMVKDPKSKKNMTFEVRKENFETKRYEKKKGSMVKPAIYCYGEHQNFPRLWNRLMGHKRNGWGKKTDFKFFVWLAGSWIIIFWLVLVIRIGNEVWSSMTTWGPIWKVSGRSSSHLEIVQLHLRLLLIDVMVDGRWAGGPTLKKNFSLLEEMICT